MKRIVFLFILAAAAGCTHRQPDQALPENAVVQDPDAEWEEFMRYADSVSAITGIGYGPYFYDPAWSLSYSANGDTLFYFPRDSAATFFTIPPSVQVIEERAFQCNRHLTALKIPSGVREIGLCSFYACSQLREVFIQGPVASIPWRAFDSCSSLETVDLPETVDSLDGFSFAGCEKLRTFIVRNPEPPELLFYDEEFALDEGEWAFAGTDLSKCTLYVPVGSVSKYRETLGWNQFKRIRAIDTRHP